MICKCCEKEVTAVNGKGYCLACEDIPESHPAKYRVHPSLKISKIEYSEQPSKYYPSK